VNINTVTDAIAQAIAVDATLSAWCVSTYGRVATVYINFDRRDAPGEENCPFVSLRPTSYTSGRGVDSEACGIEIVSCVYDDEARTWVADNVSQGQGVYNLEQMNQYVISAVGGASLPANAVVEDFNLEYETVDLFPFILAGGLYNIRAPLTIGYDPMA